jgi:Transglycosylase SLT domain
MEKNYIPTKVYRSLHVASLTWALLFAQQEVNANPESHLETRIARNRWFQLHDTESELISKNIRQSKACHPIINQKGEVGDWGKTILSEVTMYPKSFENNLPSEIMHQCPAYLGWNQEQRRLFWVWTFAAMAQPESTCNPNEITSGPSEFGNIAIGLFQVHADHECRDIGDLSDPHINSKCAVKKLARELEQRTTLTASHSRRGGTYWAPLRNDSRNSTNKIAHKSFMSLLGKYSFCDPKLALRAPSDTTGEGEMAIRRPMQSRSIAQAAVDSQK